MGRGFSALFWGILLILALMLGVCSVRVPLLARVPGHLLGLLLLLAGVRHLRRAFPGDPGWQRLVRVLALAVVGQLYLLPFLGWWRNGTAGWYTLLNALLLLAGSLVLLVVLPRLAQAFAERVADPELRMETRICLWAVPVLGGLGLALIVFRGRWLAIQTDPLFALQHLWLSADPLLLFPGLLPVVPALLISWEIKQRCFRSLVAGPETTPE